MTTINFKDFDNLVKIYYPLNKRKSRFLIFFKDDSFYFYKYSYDKKNKWYCLTKEYPKWNESKK